MSSRARDWETNRCRTSRRTGASVWKPRGNSRRSRRQTGRDSPAEDVLRRKFSRKASPLSPKTPLRRGQATLQTRIGHVVFAVGLTAGLVPRPTRASENRLPGSALPVALVKGWNLVRVARGVRHEASSPQHLDLHAWPATTTLPSASGASFLEGPPTSPVSVNKIEAGSTYWIWSPHTTPLIWAPSRVDSSDSFVGQSGQKAAIQETKRGPQRDVSSHGVAGNLSGESRSGWRYILPLENLEDLSPPPERLLRWNGDTQSYALASLTQPLEPTVGYLALFSNQETRDSQGPQHPPDALKPVDANAAVPQALALQTPFSRPKKPDRLRAELEGASTTVLSWQRPRHFADGAPLSASLPLAYRVYKDDALLEELDNTTRHEDPAVVFDREVRYYVTAVLKGPHGGILESLPSDLIRFFRKTPIPPPPPGDFETPHPVTDGRRGAFRPKAKLSRFGDTIYAHLAYLNRDKNGQPREVRYQRSARAGKAGSFTQPVILAEVGPQSLASDLTLAVHTASVSISWIESGPLSNRILTRVSHDGGQSFADPVVVREAGGPKHGLDAAYDPSGEHHLIWGEDHKVYYLKNFDGEPENVFDTRHRSPATEQVRYQVFSEPVRGACPCDDCWCDESYPLSEETDPKNPGQNVGPYVTHTVAAYIYQASLHVDEEAVTIIGRQKMSWNDKPVAHKPWLDHHPVYEDPENSVWRNGTRVRLTKGWRKIWKQSFEAGDEALWEGLGLNYQYRYAGTRQKQDLIKVAQRPLVPGAWADTVQTAQGETVRAGWTQGTWRDDTFASWRISVVDKDHTHEGKLAHPQVLRTPDARLFAVFEKGPSLDPNAPDLNPIYGAHSYDGGQSWSPPTRIATGYVPQLTATDGELAILYYEAHGAAGAMHVLRPEQDGTRWVRQDAVHRHPPLAVHPRSHTDVPFLWNAPSLAGLGDLFLAAWVQKATSVTEQDRIVVTRASRNTEAHHLDIQVTRPSSHPRGTKLTVTVENQNHMRVVHHGSPNPNLPPAPLQDAVVGQGISPFSVSMEKGQGSVWWAGDLSIPEGNTLVGLGEASVDLSAQSEGVPSLKKNSPQLQRNREGNYARATEARKRLYRFEEDPDTGKEWGYLVEYDADLVNEEAVLNIDRLNHQRFEQPELRDAKHLAGFERVWVYTQGIALAQFARRNNEEEVRYAQASARFLCNTLVIDSGTGLALGWPFSWNTDGDDWRDARLVTGANAWAVHGLGHFITSKAFESLPSQDEQASFLACYQDALRGLEAHRRDLQLEDGRPISLMTAGWTTLGLKFATEPTQILMTNQVPVTEDSSIQFAYYSVLDAIGYNTYTEPPKIKTCQKNAPADCIRAHQGSSSFGTEITEDVWSALGQRVKADNVVTEHNLDVLAVLNHALHHAPTLGLTDTDALLRWRNQLRDGIFFGLWDDRSYRTEFQEALDTMSAQNPFPKTVVQEDRHQERQRWMKEALESDNLGRIVTGGEIHQAQDGSLRLEISTHSAIDNCSWLALSVDDQDWAKDPKSEAIYVERLGQCLKYTVIQYAKELGFGPALCDPRTTSCPPRQTYRGAHYFQNAFKDPYIAPSELQESSYHLEATMGLVLGLHAFASAHPTHPEAAQFETEARSLWTGTQAFVRDHGFPYSSQRIQDLSTLLSSSTAVIWFMDAHDILEGEKGDIDRPLLPYAQDLSAKETRAFVDNAYLTLQEGQSDGDRGLLVSGTTEGRTYTFVEEQALAVLVALARNDHAQAAFWLRPLRAALFQSAEPSDASTGFFTVLDTQTGTPVAGIQDIGSTMLTLYALAKHIAVQGGASRESAVHDLSLGLERSQVLIQKTGATQGLFVTPGFTTARTDDNVLAYFALFEAQAVLPTPEAAESLEPTLDTLVAHLLRMCTGPSSQTPLEAIGADGQEHRVESPRTYGLCSLFLAHLGDMDGAERLLLDMEHSHSAFLAPAETQALGIKSRSSWADAISGILARQALSNFDARQGELALKALAPMLAMANPPESPSLSLAPPLLAASPNGMFGVEHGFESVGESIGPEQNAAEAYRDLREILLHQYQESLFALLLSSTEGVAFDLRFHRLARFRFFLDQADRLVPPNQWTIHDPYLASDWIHQTDYELLDLCQRGPVPVPSPDCRSLSSLYQSLRDAKVGRGGDLEIMLVSAPPLETQKRLNELRLIRRFGRSEVWTQDQANRFCLTCNLHGDDLNLPKEASTDELQHQLQQTLEAALTEPLRAHGPTPLVLSMPSMDVISALHPVSSTYWTRTSVLLRYALSQPANNIQIWLQGTPVDAFRFPASAEQKENVVALRRLANRAAHGDLFLLASQTGLDAHVLHDILRTGELDEDAYGILKNLAAQKTPEAVKFTPRASAFDFDRTPTPSFENLSVAFEDLVAGVTKGHFANAPSDMRVELGARLALVPSKLASRLGPQAAKWMGDVTRLPRELFLGAVAGLNLAAYVGSAQIDVGLETILVSGERPSSAFWEPVGFVKAESVVAWPTGAHLKNEDTLRRDTTIHPKGPHLDSPLPEVGIRFEDENVYLIQIDWWGLELPSGHFGILAPDTGALWPVFELRTDRPRSELLEHFVHNHRFWKHFAPYADRLAKKDQAAFLYLLELVVRGEFDRLSAESFVVGPQRFAPGSILPAAPTPKTLSSPIKRPPTLKRLANAPHLVWAHPRGDTLFFKPTLWSPKELSPNHIQFPFHHPQHGRLYGSGPAQLVVEFLEEHTIGAKGPSTTGGGISPRDDEEDEDDENIGFTGMVESAVDVPFNFAIYEDFIHGWAQSFDPRSDALQKDMRNEFLQGLKTHSDFRDFLEEDTLRIVYYPESRWSGSPFRSGTAPNIVWHLKLPDASLEKNDRLSFMEPQQLIWSFKQFLFELFYRGVISIRKESESSFTLLLGATRMTVATQDPNLLPHVKNALETYSQELESPTDPIMVDPFTDEGQTIIRVVTDTLLSLRVPRSSGYATPNTPLNFDRLFKDDLLPFKHHLKRLRTGGGINTMEITSYDLQPHAGRLAHLMVPTRLFEATVTLNNKQQEVVFFLGMKDKTKDPWRFAMSHAHSTAGRKLSVDYHRLNVVGDFPIVKDFTFTELDLSDDLQESMHKELTTAVEQAAVDDALGLDNLLVKYVFGMDKDEVLTVGVPIAKPDEREKMQAVIVQDPIAYHLIGAARKGMPFFFAPPRIPLRTWEVQVRPHDEQGLFGPEPGRLGLLRTAAPADEHTDQEELFRYRLVRSVTSKLAYLFHTHGVDLKKARLFHEDKFSAWLKDALDEWMPPSPYDGDNETLTQFEAVSLGLYFLSQAIRAPADARSPFSFSGLKDVAVVKDFIEGRAVPTPKAGWDVPIEIQPDFILSLVKWDFLPAFFEDLLRDFGYNEPDHGWRKDHSDVKIWEALQDANEDWQHKDPFSLIQPPKGWR